jgi:iron complex outermembrane receptor protein
VPLPGALCTRDIYTDGIAFGGVGWNKPQNIKGNSLPNAPRNKVAVNVMYTFHFDFGSLSPSVSYVWRDAQYGNLFTRSYNRSPSWDQWDARVRWVSDDGNWEGIVFGKNLFDTIGYDGGSQGTRLAGTIDVGAGATRAIACGASATVYPPNGTCNFVQGVNNPVGYGAVRGENAQGIVTTVFNPTPPRTWGIQLDYKL